MGEQSVLVLNSGSSNIKFSVFEKKDFSGSVNTLNRVLSGKIEGIGNETASPSVAADSLISRIDQKIPFSTFSAVGHRVVHGGEKYVSSARVTTELLKELERLSSFDPDHLPAEIAIMTEIQIRYPDLFQVACFDTAFHHDLPMVAKRIPIPRRYEAKGIRKYGFHGISYEFLLRELRRIGKEKEAEGRIIFAHLGNGASLAAVHRGKCLDTSMCFTPASGIPMSTRSGDLDPGLFWYLNQTEGTTPQQFNQMVNKESGLLGISETSSDFRNLLKAEAKDSKAKEAVDYFCFQVKKWIGGFAAVLGGLDTLVFSGGIGENAPVIRERICANLEFLGIQLDPSRNHDPEVDQKNAFVISDPNSRVMVRVIRTNEEIMIAEEVFKMLHKGN
jgi:acetate kinase